METFKASLRIPGQPKLHSESSRKTNCICIKHVETLSCHYSLKQNGHLDKIPLLY